MKAARARTSIAQRGMVLVALPLVFELLFVSLLIYCLRQAEARTQRELKSQAIVEKSTILLRKMVALGLYSSVFHSSSKDSLLDGKSGEKSIGETLKELDLLVADESSLKPSFKQIKRSARQVHQLILRFSKQDLSSWMSNMAGSSLFGEVSVQLREFNHSVRMFSAKAGSRKFIESGRKQLPQLIKVPELLVGGLLLNLLLTVLLAMAFARNISSRLAKLAKNTQRVSQGLTPLEIGGSKDELNKLDLVIHELSKQLQEAEKQQSQLAAMLKDRLKIPLSEAALFLKQLQEKAGSELSDSGQDWLKISSKNLDRLGLLLDDLLQTQNIQKGFIELSFGESRSSEIVKASIEAVASLLAKKDICIEQDLEELVFQADQARLTQVLINLLSNAIKFSPSGSSIRISSISLGGRVEFRVKDSGPGIAKNDKTRIFQRYEQSQRSDASIKGGSGLGLNIAAIILKSHQGEIGVESEPGQGSEFYFRVPIFKSDQAIQAIQSQAKPLQLETSMQAGESSKAPLQSLRIWHKGLIVVAVPLFFQIFFVLLLSNMLARAERETAVELHALQISSTANALFREAVTLSTTAGGVAIRENNDRDSYSYGVTLEYILEDLCELFELTKSDRNEREKASAIFHSSEKVLASTAKLMLAQMPTSSLTAMIEFKQNVKSVESGLDGLAQSIARLLAKEQKIAEESPAKRARSKADIDFLIIEILTLSVLLSVLLALFFSNSISNKLKVLIQNTLLFAESKNLLPALEGDDELSQFDREFRLMAARLQENKQFKQDLLAIVSHELRTPLTSVFGALTMIQQGVYGQVSKPTNEIVQQAYQRILQVILLVNDLLDIEKLEAEKYPIEIRKVEILDTVEQALSSARETFPELNLNIKGMQYSSELETDEILCTKAISKLLVFCCEAAGIDDQIQLEIKKDNGFCKLQILYPGRWELIDSKRIFEKFQILEQAEAADIHRGGALCLALCKSIVSQIGGELSCLAPKTDSEHGSFCISLPE